MINRPKGLPDFSSPPLIEVALSVQFDELDSFRNIYAGLLWSKFRKNFPKCGEDVPIPSSFETFGGQLITQQEPQIQLQRRPMSSRHWFLNEPETELIQIQNNRFTHNWRKIDDKEVYPRYEKIRRKFVSELKQVKAFFKEHGLGEITPNQVEVTYVNMILPEEKETLQERFGSVFQNWSSRNFAGSVGAIEMSGFNSRYILDDEGPVARLYVSANSFTPPGLPSAINFTLSARGKPNEPTIKAVTKFMNFGRKKIVTAFSELTTNRMHERWGRK